MPQVVVEREHEICMGHRVVGHEGKCRHLHGHNYKFVFRVREVDNELDKVGRVVDFSVVKSILCEWLEDNWDHKFMAWEDDNLISAIENAVEEEGIIPDPEDAGHLHQSIVYVPFNPTAENIAIHFVEKIAPELFEEAGHGDLELFELVIHETSKCHVIYSKDQ